MQDFAQLSLNELRKLMDMQEKTYLRDSYFLNGSGNPMLQKSSGKSFDTLRVGIPTSDFMPQYTNRSWLAWAYYFEQEVSILSDICQKIRDEVFRNRLVWEPKFVKKCLECDKEFQFDVESCDRCGSFNLIEPDPTQLEWLKRLDGTNIMDDANYNHQSLVDVLKQCDMHISVADNMYLMCIKKYIFEGKTLKHSIVKEFMALDPRDVVLLYDINGQMGKVGRICLEHRLELIRSGDSYTQSSPEDKTKYDDTVCPHCGKPTYEAWYMTQAPNGLAKYYTKDEIFHKSFYYPSMLYGYPVPLKLQDDLWAYHYIEKRTRAFYETARAPGIMFVPMSNQEALSKAWLTMVEQIKQDPYTIPVVGTSESAPTQANFIRLLEDPNPNLIAVKNDLRERISSRYGVTVTFSNDARNQQGNTDSQNLITITDRTIEGRQKFHNEGGCSWISRQLGISDYVLRCAPHLGENEMADEQLFSLKIQNARGMMEMGFDIKYDDRNFSYSGQPKDLLGINMMQGMMGQSNPADMADNPMDPTAPNRRPEPTPPSPGPERLEGVGDDKKGRTLGDLYG